MTDMEIQDFVTRFAAAWATRDVEAFLALWHPEGRLHSPLYDRPVAGKELGRLTEIVKERAPDSVWQLLDWTARGDTVVIEWQNTRIARRQAFRLARSRQVPPARWQDPGRARLCRHGAAARGGEGRTPRGDHLPVACRLPL